MVVMGLEEPVVERSQSAFGRKRHLLRGTSSGNSHSPYQPPCCFTSTKVLVWECSFPPCPSLKAEGRPQMQPHPDKSTKDQTGRFWEALPVDPAQNLWQVPASGKTG